MKGLLKELVGRAVRADGTWRVLDASILRLARYVQWQRDMFVESRRGGRTLLVDEAMRAVCPDLVVRHGPFSGMRYLDECTHGSALFPKLLGSYEREVQPLIERICVERPYTEVVDIGCAEGYYAVGLALRMPSVRVFAFDTDSAATRLLQLLAERNGVADRIVVGGACSPAAFRSLPLTKRALVLSDCEGYEKTLFDAPVIAWLSRHDVLIEVHDLIDIEISDVLRERFQKTHDLEVIRSIDDVEKPRRYDYPEITHYSLKDRKSLLAEHRSAVMEWFFFRSRAAAPRAHPVYA